MPAVFVCALGAATLLCARPSRAADTDVIEDTESGRVQRQLEVDAAIQQASREAAARQALESGERVTFEQILADPDNIDLNFRYAKTQVADGDLVGASATLERILMIEPELPPIRLFYALVLYRLDNLEEAEREFRLLESIELPEEPKKQVAHYLKQIKKQQRRTHLVSSTTIGWGFDTNRNAAPASKRRFFADTPLPLTGNSRKRRDTNFLGVQTFNVTHDFGKPGGHHAIGTLSYLLGEQTSVDDLDLQSFSGDLGVVIKTPLVELTPAGFGSYLYLSRETYLRSQGGRLRAERPLGDKTGLFAEGTYTREDFEGITENTAAPERSGPRYNFNIGGQRIITPSMQLSAEIGYEHKDVNEPPFELNTYEGFSLTGTHLWLLGKGQFLMSALTYGVDSYQAPDFAISAMKRRDQQLRARLTYGFPVALLLGRWLPETLLSNLTATASLEQFRSLSNITNYTYSNSKFGTMLTKRIEF